MNTIPGLSAFTTGVIWLAEKAADSFSRTVQAARSSIAAAFNRNQNAALETPTLAARLISPLEYDEVNNVPIVSVYTEGQEPVYPESNPFIDDRDIESSRPDYRGDGALVNAQEGNWDSVMRDFGNKASIFHYCTTGEMLPMLESNRKGILAKLETSPMDEAKRQKIKNALGGNGIFAAVFR